jgi:hypothetical protein
MSDVYSRRPWTEKLSQLCKDTLLQGQRTCRGISQYILCYDGHNRLDVQIPS